MTDHAASDHAASDHAASDHPARECEPIEPIEPPDLPPPFVSPDTLPGLIRQVRRLADLSQRELASAAHLSRSAVARIEAGSLVPSLPTLLRLLGAAQLTLVATDEHGTVIQPMQLWDDTRDGAGRLFPAHLDLILDPRGDDWWASVYGLARPPETYHRDREWRDAKRRRSQWEVRVAQLRHAPPPPDPARDPHWRWRHRQQHDGFYPA